MSVTDFSIDAIMGNNNETPASQPTPTQPSFFRFLRPSTTTTTTSEPVNLALNAPLSSEAIQALAMQIARNTEYLLQFAALNQPPQYGPISTLVEPIHQLPGLQVHHDDNIVPMDLSPSGMANSGTSNNDYLNQASTNMALERQLYNLHERHQQYVREHQLILESQRLQLLQLGYGRQYEHFQPETIANNFTNLTISEPAASTSPANSTSSTSTSSTSNSNNSCNGSNGARGSRKPRPKKFDCPFCWVCLSNSGQFRGHLRTHTGERPFRCDYQNCGKTFTRNEELTRHKRIHTGERPHVCPICKKNFGRKDHLAKHLRTHERQRLRTLQSNGQIAMFPPTGNLTSTPKATKSKAKPKPKPKQKSCPRSSSNNRNNNDNRRDRDGDPNVIGECSRNVTW